jgi:acetylornithine/succinyldiaminopimelate/putrescine aminotransferase
VAPHGDHRVLESTAAFITSFQRWRAGGLPHKGALSREAHDAVVRLAPSLAIACQDLDRVLDGFEGVVHEFEPLPRPTKSA